MSLSGTPASPGLVNLRAIPPHCLAALRSLLSTADSRIVEGLPRASVTTSGRFLTGVRIRGIRRWSRP